MKLKIALSTATAIGLIALTGAAWAGSNNTATLHQHGQRNSATLGQGGNSNSALIEQEGNDNQAGKNGIYGRMNQGTFNKLTVQQDGNRNKVGIAGNNLGIDQQARDNTLFIRQGSSSQDGNDNTITDVTQAGNATGGAIVDGAQVNTATLTQDGHNNLIDSVYQKTRVAAGNKLTVNQDGASNIVNTISQTHPDGSTASNVATVKQDGTDNKLDSLSQNGDGNVATISVDGWRNGAGLLTSGALAAGAATSTVHQSGSGNRVQYTVSTGNDNQFGFYQNDTNNSATGILINGNGNELGVYQDGVSNSLSLAAINDDDNVFGVRQVGDQNRASITSSGGKNGGHESFAAGGAAAMLAGLDASHSLTAGLMEQRGDLNRVSLDVSGGSKNVFASLQDNDGIAGAVGNRITATQDGSSNQAAVLQVGDNNATTLTQSGGQNNASIQQ